MATWSRDNVYDPQGRELGHDNAANGNWYDEDIWAAGQMMAQSFPSEMYFLHHNTLGTDVQLTNHAGAPTLDMLYQPWGQLLTHTGYESDAHYAGFQQAGGNLNATPTRQYANPLGRWITPDPGGKNVVHLNDPQTWNAYSYALNNPATRTDPTGLYTCADDSKCRSKQDVAFESARQNDLNSRNADIVRAAQAYGDPTKGNGVTVQFGNPGKGEGGTTVSSLGSDSQGHLRANSLVTISPKVRGSDLDALVAHEGSHALDAQTEVSRINATGSNFRQVLNIHERASELRAYGMTDAELASGNVTRSFCPGDCKLGAGVPPWQVQESINKILSLAPYNLGPGDEGPLIIPLPPEP